MKAPDKLYVVQMKTESQDAFVGLAYELDKLLVSKTEYIRKDALLEWVMEKMNINLEEADKTDDRFTYGVATGFGSVIDKLNSL